MVFNMSEKPDLRGSGFRILNFLRACNLISLVTNMAATWAMIVMTGMTNSFYFFDGVSHFWIFCITLFFAFSEMQFAWFKPYFANNWPIFGPDHSFVWLGLGMVMLGCDLLGNLNKPQFSETNLGMPIWRLVLGAGILSITFGFFNIAASFVFRDRQNGITARMIRSDGNLAAPKPKGEVVVEDYFSAQSGSQRGLKEPAPRFNRVTKLFTKSPFRASRKMEISNPILHPRDDDLEAGSHTGSHTGSHSDTWDQDRASPIVPDMQRPPTAMHPAYTGGNRSTRSNAYSVANMPRF